MNEHGDQVVTIIDDEDDFTPSIYGHDDIILTSQMIAHLNQGGKLGIDIHGGEYTITIGSRP